MMDILGMMVFLATCLALAGGLIAAAVALFTRQTGRARRILFVLLGWVALYAAVLLLSSLTSRPHYLNSGQERCFDEMCYSVKAVSITDQLGTPPDAVQAAGKFTVITLQLRSDARRTAQKPSQPALFLIDEDGKRYSQMINAGEENGLKVGQPVTAAQLWNRKIQPGETVLRQVAFDLPPGAHLAGLVFSEGIGPLSVIIIGDENSLFHARTVLRLSP